MTLKLDQAQRIFMQAKTAGIDAGQYKAAANALARNDLKAFERICRASHAWLKSHNIDYTLTDGVADWFYPTVNLGSRFVYKNGALHGPSEWFYSDGPLGSRCFYKAGKLHGLSEVFFPNGALMSRRTYVDGALIGLPLEFNPDGTPIYP
jgi:hypothetical protein